MANYTTSVSDISQRQLMKAWTRGLLGTLGLHFFKLGRIKRGIVRLLWGVIMWTAAILVALDPEIRAADGGAFASIVILFFLFIPSIIDLVRIKLGVFRDNVGNVVREK